MSSRGFFALTSVVQRAAFFLGICTMLTGVVQGEAGKYLGPIDVVAAPDQKTLYVVLLDAQRIDVLDAASNQIVRNIACPAVPTGLAVQADGSKLFVTCGGVQGVVCVVVGELRSFVQNLSGSLNGTTRNTQCFCGFRLRSAQICALILRPMRGHVCDLRGHHRPLCH